MKEKKNGRLETKKILLSLSLFWKETLPLIDSWHSKGGKEKGGREGVKNQLGDWQRKNLTGEEFLSSKIVWCYKTFFGASLENSHFPLAWTKKKRPF